MVVQLLWNQRLNQLPSAIVLLTPVVLAFLSGSIAEWKQDNDGKAAWSWCRSLTRVILTVTVAAWCAISQMEGIEQSLLPMFWAPPMVSLGLFLFICYTFDRKLMHLRWSSWQITWRVWWKLVALVIPPLLLVGGCRAFMDRQLLTGVAYFITAGIVGRVGSGLSRWADGIRFHVLKTGEVKNSAFALARDMGIDLQRVFVVPAGRGRLTNAFGIGDSIGVTDNLGKYLSKEQIRVVLAHELAHLKLKHGRKYLMVTLGVYSFLAVCLMLAAPVSRTYRAINCVAIILLPPLLTFWVSRRMEFNADRMALRSTQDAENAIRMLAKLHKNQELPARRSSLAELFATHPSFERRVLTLAQTGEVPTDRLNAILADERVEFSHR